MQRFTGEGVITTGEGIRKKIQEKMHGHKTYGYGRWATILKNGEHFMGCSGLAYLFEFEEIVVVYRFLPEFWKRGLATEATRAILAYAFEELKLKRIVAIALTENRASIRVMEKTGMKFDILKRLPLNRFHQ